MSTSFWWTLPPLPKQKRGKRPAEPGFTDEELQYLENTLQIVSVMLKNFGLGLVTAMMVVRWDDKILTYILGN
jgi:hypothetical protein